MDNPEIKLDPSSINDGVDYGSLCALCTHKSVCKYAQEVEEFERVLNMTNPISRLVAGQDSIHIPNILRTVVEIHCPHREQA